MLRCVLLPPGECVAWESRDCKRRRGRSWGVLTCLLRVVFSVIFLALLWFNFALRCLEHMKLICLFCY